MGAVLSQSQEEADQPVAFFSKKLLPREKQYSAVEKDCLANMLVTMATIAGVVSISVVVVMIVGVVCLALFVYIVCWRRKGLQQSVKSEASLIVYRIYIVMD